MHPADQLTAFMNLVEEYKTIGQIAAAFGVSPLTVERRLKLATLAPMFIDLYREGEIAQDQLEALVISTDHQQQVDVWKSLTHGRSAYRIHQMLTESENPTSRADAQFFGLDAYRVVGGQAREYLFFQKNGYYLQDPALLQRLAIERQEQLAEQVRDAGWKWVETAMIFNSQERGRFAQLRPTDGKPSKRRRH